MKCKNTKCDNEHNGNFGSGKFCSRACANSRSFSEESNQKRRESVNRHYTELPRGTPKKSPEQIAKQIQTFRERYEKELLAENFSNLKFGRLRRRLLLEQNGACNRCGLTEWLSEPIVLELEHKDGNNQNNTRENLEAICPNCHSLTKTWRGRNKTPSQLSRPQYTEEQIVTAYLETGNIRQALLKLGLAAKGANYGRVKRALTLWGIKY